MPTFLQERTNIIEEYDKELRRIEAEKNRIPGTPLEEINKNYWGSLVDFVIKCQPFHCQQVFLARVSGLVRIEQTDKAFRDSGIEVIFNKVRPVL